MWPLILDKNCNSEKMCMNWCRCDAEVPGDCNGGWPQECSRQKGKDTLRQTLPPPPTPPSTDAIMAREQPNVGDLLPLLETSDLHQLEEIRGLINEQLSTGMATWFVHLWGGWSAHVELPRKLREIPDHSSTLSRRVKIRMAQLLLEFLSILNVTRTVLPRFPWRARIHAAERPGGLLLGNKLCPGYAYPLLSQRTTR